MGFLDSFLSIFKSSSKYEAISDMQILYRKARSFSGKEEDAEDLEIEISKALTNCQTNIQRRYEVIKRALKENQDYIELKGRKVAIETGIILDTELLSSAGLEKVNYDIYEQEQLIRELNMTLNSHMTNYGPLDKEIEAYKKLRDEHAKFCKRTELSKNRRTELDLDIILTDYDRLKKIS